MSERITIKEGGNFKKAKEYFDNNDCYISLSREIEKNDFFIEFLDYFKHIDNLSMSSYGNGVSYDFLYKMPNLKSLYLHCMYEVDFSLLKSLKDLSIWWNKKMISNFDKLQNLEHLSINEFDEKDLSKLSALTNLKTLSFKTAKIKSLKGIEKLTNLKCISFGGVRGLSDISDIVTLQKLKYLEFDICWKLQDFSPIGQLQELEVLELLDCKNLASINFIKNMPKLKQLVTLGTTLINDLDTRPAKDISIFFGSINNKYNNQYPEKEIQNELKSWSDFNS